MPGFLESLSSDVVTGVIALPVGYYTRVGVVKVRDRLRARDVIDLFGLQTGPVTIVHSVIYDERRNAYNFPSSDSRASRIIAQLFDSANRREGADFFVEPESEILIGDQVDPRIWRRNLVLLCGPKRNAAVAEALARLPAGLNYTMGVDPVSDRNTLRDNRRNQLLKSSREDTNLGGTVDGRYDYGLILSARNLIHPGATVTILAGIHGTGTLGCASFLNDPRNIHELLRRRRNEVIAEVIRVDYGNELESIVDTTLV